MSYLKPPSPPGDPGGLFVRRGDEGRFEGNRQSHIGQKEDLMMRMSISLAPAALACGGDRYSPLALCPSGSSGSSPHRLVTTDPAQARDPVGGASRTPVRAPGSLLN